MVRVDHSESYWLYPSAGTNAKTALKSLIGWSAAFSLPEGSISDGPTHLKNETIRLLVRGLRTHHRFELPYCPWSNGGIEQLEKESVRVARLLLFEVQLRQDGWPPLVPLIQSALEKSSFTKTGQRFTHYRVHRLTLVSASILFSRKVSFQASNHIRCATGTVL